MGDKKKNKAKVRLITRKLRQGIRQPLAKTSESTTEEVMMKFYCFEKHDKTNRFDSDWE